MELLSLFLFTGFGVLVGTTGAYMVMKARMAVAVEQVRSAAAAELAQVSQKASRVETLEAEVTAYRGQMDALRNELNQLTGLEAKSRQAFESTTQQFQEAKTKLREQEQQLADTVQQLQTAMRRCVVWETEAGRIPRLEQDLQNEKAQATQTARQLTDLRQIETRLKAELESERKIAARQAELLSQARQEFAVQFKNLANEILEDKSKRFTEQNLANLTGLLTPLGQRLGEFKSKIEQIHLEDTKQQTELKSELKRLQELNTQMTQEAHSLATALKGQAKKQGNWGELVLANVLERSGLQEGRDFLREASFVSGEGDRQRPDVVVKLPQNKCLVIDAKVSLNAYTRYVNEEDEAQRLIAIRQHVAAISDRISELSRRNYFNIPDLNSPEVVFMFIPIESAFVDAVRADESLFQKALEQNILIATPTTLLTSLNIVKQLWRFEEQNAHAAELADRAAKVYRKLVGFVETMSKTRDQLKRAAESFDRAMGQLYSGKGNLIAQALEFERLGVSVLQARIPEDIAAKAALELEYQPDLSDQPGGGDAADPSTAK